MREDIDELINYHTQIKLEKETKIIIDSLKTLKNNYNELNSENRQPQVEFNDHEIGIIKNIIRHYKENPI